MRRGLKLNLLYSRTARLECNKGLPYEKGTETMDPITEMHLLGCNKGLPYEKGTET